MDDIIYSNMTHTLGDGVQVRYEMESGKLGWICPKCGASVAPNLKTCPVCGSTTTDESLNPGEQMICG